MELIEIVEKAREDYNISEMSEKDDKFICEVNSIITIEFRNNNEIVERLIGSIHSVGSSHIDSERYENLKEYCELVCEMINEICDEAKNSKRFEYSMKKSGKEAISYLKSINVTIDDCLNYYGDVE